MVVGGLSPLSTWLVLPLEIAFRAPCWAPRRRHRHPRGAEDSRVAAGRGTHALNEAAERLTEAAALARRYPNAKVAVHRRRDRIIGRPDDRCRCGGDSTQRPGRGRAIVSSSNVTHAIRRRTRSSPNRSPIPNRASAGCWSLPLGICRGRWVFSQSRFRCRTLAERLSHCRPGRCMAAFCQSPSEGLRRLDFVVKEWLGLAVNWADRQVRRAVSGAVV